MGTIYDIIEPHGVTKPASVMILLNIFQYIQVGAIATIKIFHLKTNTGTKLAVYGVFLLASIGLAASITRAAYIIQMFRVAQLDPDADSRLGDTLIIFWSNLEASVCLLAVNLPSLWAYKTLLPPTQFLASVRSFIAIQFGRSTTLNQASHEIVIPDNRFENSSSSVANMCANNNWVDVYAMHELESQNQHIAVPEGAILVDSHVLLTTQNKNVRGHE
ncbi:predicted protein [Sclerotinia sclerotiorum 1980 UF-70]|uniref:Rhodopsin domain-containing protein n=1 Tax=Sclerotinia sclerotiorum (strain ATCC 18683 / 1980 / Ss-1) TaxID=665079 RepID=A7EZA9_SCLS1|nr:predicted protein [Sclerotinia sclerotiorum 1980 UF-70]EDN94801.1 predicted protein [Sclerotinia sclerotiorum 1980 UF-70]